MLRRLISSASLIAFSTLHGASPTQELLGIGPKSVRQISDPKTIQLKEKVVWNRIEKGKELGLLPGVYEATSEADAGRFYVGKGPSLFMKTVRGQYLVAFGDVWLQPQKKRRLDSSSFKMTRCNEVRRLRKQLRRKQMLPTSGPVGWSTCLFFPQQREVCSCSPRSTISPLPVDSEASSAYKIDS